MSALGMKGGGRMIRCCVAIMAHSEEASIGHVLALLAAPVLPLVKWLRTIGVFMSQQP